jgi:hypothetical protein
LLSLIASVSFAFKVERNAARFCQTSTIVFRNTAHDLLNFFAPLLEGFTNASFATNSRLKLLRNMPLER